MSNQVTGRLFKILPAQHGSGKNGAWVKQEFVIETTEQYPKKICLCAWGDKVDELKGIQLGDTLNVSFNLESREYNERWFTDVRAWKIEREGEQQQKTATIETEAPKKQKPPVADPSDDLPF
jgi:hypothetical protein